MLNRGNSQFLNNFNHQQFDGPLVLDNQNQGIVSDELLNNIQFLKQFKNKMNNGNIYLDINKTFPQLNYQNQSQRNINNNINNLNFQGDFDEYSLIDLIRNLSLEPPNQKINNIPSLAQLLYANKNTVGIQNPQIQQSLQSWAGGINLKNGD